MSGSVCAPGVLVTRKSPGCWRSHEHLQHIVVGAMGVDGPEESANGGFGGCGELSAWLRLSSGVGAGFGLPDKRV